MVPGFILAASLLPSTDSGAQASILGAFGLSNCSSQALVAPRHVKYSLTRDQTRVLYSTSTGGFLPTVHQRSPGGSYFLSLDIV